MKTKPITIRGTTYASGLEAAKALGVTTGAISKARTKGRLNTAGTGRGNTKHATVNGRDFDSVKEAANFFDVPPDQMSNYLSVLRKIEAKEGNRTK